MVSVTDTSTSRKLAKAFYAQLHGLSGVLTKPGPAVLFLDPASGAVVTITPTDTPHLLVLGEVGTATAQYLTDRAAGGYAAIATSRQMEVQ